MKFKLNPKIREPQEVTKTELNTTIDYKSLDNELNDMEADLEITKYHEKIASGNLTDEEKAAIKNLDKVTNMSLDDFFSHFSESADI